MGGRDSVEVRGSFDFFDEVRPNPSARRQWLEVIGDGVEGAESGILSRELAGPGGLIGSSLPKLDALVRIGDSCAPRVLRAGCGRIAGDIASRLLARARRSC